jgi:hypothetical protein
MIAPARPTNMRRFIKNPSSDDFGVPKLAGKSDCQQPRKGG